LKLRDRLLHQLAHHEIFRGIDAAASLKRKTASYWRLRPRIFRGIDAAASLKQQKTAMPFTPSHVIFRGIDAAASLKLIRRSIASRTSW